MGASSRFKEEQFRQATIGAFARKEGGYAGGAEGMGAGGRRMVTPSATVSSALTLAMLALVALAAWGPRG